MILVTGGCSFSECSSFSAKKTWPKHLENSIHPTESYHTGIGSIGNGLISRSIIYRVSELIKKNTVENLLVGIMWSGPNRYDFFKSNIVFEKNIDGCMSNPTGFIDKKNDWIVCNPWWNHEYSVEYYKKFFDEVGAYVYTLEHILRTQWFLKYNNIKYFMTTYTGEVLPKTQTIKSFFKTLSDIEPTTLKENKHTAHLYEQIDFEHFLPVEGEYEWCRDYSGLNFPIPGDNHPSSDQHRLFTEQVIMPFLESKKYIDL